MKSSHINNTHLSKDFMLDDSMLQMPINRTKQLQDLIKLKMEQQKIIEKVNIKSMVIKESRQRKNNTKMSSISQENHLIKPHSTSTPRTLQRQFHSSYVGSCVMRALKYRKLAIDDVADIFGIESEVVEEIDKFRRLREIEAEEDTGRRVGDKRVGLKRGILMRELEMKFKNAAYEKVVQNSFTTSNHLSNPNYQQYPTSRHPSYRPQTLPSSQQAQNSHYQLPQQQQNLPQHQRLLSNRPPHKLDPKAKAIIEVLKRDPQIMQKDMIKILADQYGLRNMTQTAVSRYFKKIYQMKKHVEVLLQAKREGLVDV